MKGKKVVIGIIAALLILAGSVGVYFAFFASPVKGEVTIELGEKADLRSFLEDEEDTDVQLTTDLSKCLKKAGEYDVHFEKDGKTYTSKLVIKDTKKPTATAKAVKGFVGYEKEAKDFVTQIKDASQVKVTFKKAPDFSKEGNQEVRVLLTDESGNKNEVASSLALTKDTEAPEILGLGNIAVEKGKSVSYKKGVAIKDNADQNPTLTIDNTKVDLNKVGSYPVIYKASDKAGNTTTKTITVTVQSYVPVSYTIESVNAKAKQIVDRLGISNATKRQKCIKIFNYVHAHMAYTGSSDKSSWITGAMVAMNTGRGDCFNYWAMTKALLDAAEVENMDLTASTRAHHYWNFVRVEEGWYHLDTTPRLGHPYLCLRTDAWMTAYSNSHKLCFKWNETNKPASAQA